MGKPTMISFVENPPVSSPNNYVFYVWNCRSFSYIHVKDYKDGIALIDPPVGVYKKVFAEFVSGIFHPDSNFSKVVCDALNVPRSSFRGVRFSFKNIEIVVTKENSDADVIYNSWLQKFREINNL